jgi:hypothetical protein
VGEIRPVSFGDKSKHEKRKIEERNKKKCERKEFKRVK